VRDLLGRLTFCITIREIQKINGYFFGGQVVNILEASTVEQYLARAEQEQKYYDWLAKNPNYDSLMNDSLRIDSVKRGILDTTLSAADRKALGMKNNSLNTSTDDDKPQIRKEVVDRKYYEGKFDDEIPVKLFIRYMKDPKSGKVVSYDGLYKFADQRVYARLNITIEEDGKWLMEDDPPVGTLELELKNKVYTGSWTNNGNQTGYDVELKQTDIPEAKLEQLENILERGLSGSVNEEAVEKKPAADKAKNKDKDKDKATDKTEKEKDDEEQSKQEKQNKRDEEKALRKAARKAARDNDN